MADYYFKKGSLLKTKDIGVSGSNGLLIRNIQKRLFLGVGGELLMKAFYLKRGYIINSPKDTKAHTGVCHLLGSIPDAELKDHDTFSFNALVENMHHIATFDNQEDIKTGLIILRIFRNKEGHVVTRRHAYNPSFYRAIETALVYFYEHGFSERLTMHISMEQRESGQFIIRRT